MHDETVLITHFIYDDGTFEEYGYDEYQNRNFEKDRNGNITKIISPNGFARGRVYDEAIE